nr:reverse transcriptase domain-containing protein [Tanacetum cinerariifolium]
MTPAAIRQLVTDSVTAALEAQAANMANADNTNRNPEPRKAPVARKCSYKEFMSFQPFHFKGSEGVVRLIRCIEGNVIASKPQTLEEAINIAQRLIDQCRKTTNNNAQGRAYMLRERNAHRDPNVVTDLPGLPLVRQVEFQIDLIPRAALVAHAPYRLAPLEMRELSDQL